MPSPWPVTGFYVNRHFACLFAGVTARQPVMVNACWQAVPTRLQQPKMLLSSCAALEVGSPSVCSVSAVVLPAAPAHIVCVFEQNHLAVFSVVHPLAPSISSSVASSLASSTGSGSSSPTALPTLPARALPLDPAGNTVEAVLGKSQHFFPLSSSHGHCVTWDCRICGAHVT